MTNNTNNTNNTSKLNSWLIFLIPAIVFGVLAPHWLIGGVLCSFWGGFCAFMGVSPFDERG